MQIASFTEANLAIASAYADLKAALPESSDDIDAIVSAVVLPEKVSNFFEFVYAKGNSLSAALRSAAADVGDFAWANGFYGLGENGRGMKMSAALRRKTFSVQEGDPAPKEQYAPKASTATAPAVAEVQGA